MKAADEIRIYHTDPKRYPQAAEGYHQPLDRRRYYKAPGALRCAYPTCVFLEDQAIISYGYGCNQDPIGYVACKIRILSLSWFYR